MFTKIIYYSIGMLILIYKLVRIKDIKTTKLFFKSANLKKEAEKNNLPFTKKEIISSLGKETYDQAMILAIMSVVELTWLCGGLFTYNWFLFFVMLFFLVTYNAITKNISYRHKSVFIFNTYLVLILDIIFILFVIINSFHLHIDIVKFIFGA